MKILCFAHSRSAVASSSPGWCRDGDDEGRMVGRVSSTLFVDAG